MKIVFITEISGGGVEKVNLLLASELKKNGYDVKIISLISKAEKKLDVECLYLNKKSKKNSFFSLVKTLKKEKPNIIVTYNLVETYYAYFYKKVYSKISKVVYVQHSVYSSAIYGSVKNYIKNRLIPKVTNIFSRIDGLVFVSNGVYTDFKQCFPKFKAKNVVIYNPITKGNIKYDFRRLKKDSVHLVTAGRLEEEKNQKLIIKALKLLIDKGYNVDLTIYGKGSLKPYLEKCALDYNVSKFVIFKGFSNDFEEELPEYDIFVLSSNYESFGNVLVEAMARCVSVISTDCPVGPREILSLGTYGKLVEVNNYEKLALGIEEIILQHDENMIKAAFNRSLDFNINNSVKEYENFFNQIQNK